MLNKVQVLSDRSNRGKKGYTLIELILVIVILSIIAAIVMPSFFGYMEFAIGKVCNSNCLELNKSYNTYLELRSIQHSEIVFDKFLEENDGICPRNGEISYKDGLIKCDIHSHESGSDNEEDVPYL